VPLTSNFDRQVVARMLEYVDRTSPWSRRLWSVSSVTELSEFLECSDAVAAQTLTSGSLRYLRGILPVHIMKDPGFGSQQSRAALKALLPKEDLVARGHDWHLLQMATETARKEYLGNWAAVLSAGQPVSIERCAWSVASFLLDEGISATYVHRWLFYHQKHNPAPTTLADLVAEVDGKVAGGKTDIAVLVTFSRPPKLPRPTPAGWLTPQQVPAWRLAHGCGAQGQRQYGGLILNVAAYDPYGAVAAAAERASRVRARFALGSKRRFEPNDVAWVEGIQTPFQLASEARRVEVHSLERSDQLFELTLADPAVDAALELLEPALEGQTTAAIAGAWAAVESLLTGPGDRGNVAAADRLARIVACSFPRHELTTLAWEHKRAATDALASQIAECDDNRSRARLMEAHIVSGGVASWRRPQDELAYLRLTRILLPVGQGLSEIDGYLRDSMRRL
jgi:hypothetical protein